MKSKDAVVIRYMIEHKGDELNILRISKGLKMDYKNVYSIIKRLEKNALIKSEKFGQSSRIILSPQIHPLIFEAEYNRQNDLLKNKNLAVMFDELRSAIKSKCYILLIFGSYAKKTQTKNSDIDLMFIVPDETEHHFETTISKTAKILPLPIHYLIFSETQFEEMIQARKSNVGKEAASFNVILYGIEPYYEMI